MAQGTVGEGFQAGNAGAWPERNTSALQRVDHQDPEHSKWVLVDWTLGTRCNFRCSYCPSELHDGSHAFPPPNSILEFAQILSKHYERLGRRVFVQFTGGEVTLYSDLLDILADLNQSGIRSSIISNGSRGLAYWSKLSPLLDSVTLTHHIEFANWERFRAIVAFVSERIRTNVQITMLPNRFDECLERALGIRALCSRATIGLKPLRVGFGSELFTYSAQQLEILQRPPVPPARDPIAGGVRGRMRIQDGDTCEILSAGQILARGLNRWPGWSCRAGLELLAVNAQGEVYRGLCREGGSLGNIKDKVMLPTESVVCGRRSCNCLSDIMTTKFSCRR
jgi:hypothetical protein